MIAKDKQLHLAAGLLISLLALAHPALWLLVPAAGVGKEFYDTTRGGRLDPWDIVATVGGGLPLLIWVCL